jgi:hypothetical protein
VLLELRPQHANLVKEHLDAQGLQHRAREAIHDDAAALAATSTAAQTVTPRDGAGEPRATTPTSQQAVAATQHVRVDGIHDGLHNRLDDLAVTEQPPLLLRPPRFGAARKTPSHRVDASQRHRKTSTQYVDGAKSLMPSAARRTGQRGTTLQ